MIEARFQPDLVQGERIVWTGRPDPSRIFTKADLFLVPFSLLWGGFALYWEATVLGLTGGTPAPPLFAAFGLPFVLLGLYFIIGRFVYQGWVTRRTLYAVTNQRALILRDAWGRSLDAIALASLQSVSVTARSDGSGTIVFGPSSPLDMIYGNTGLSMLRRGSYTPAFYDVPDVHALAGLIEELRTSQASTKPKSKQRR